MESNLDSVGSAKFISVADVQSAYWQIPVHPDHVERTAFVTNSGKYCYKRMPFGVCQNALIKDKCNSRSSLLDVAKYFSGIICSQKDAAMLRDAIDHLPPNRMVAPPATAFKSVLESCEFSIASWPRRFMEQEMTAAIMFCQMGGGEVDGPERAAALGRTFEYIEDKLCDVGLPTIKQLETPDPSSVRGKSNAPTAGVLLMASITDHNIWYVVGTDKPNMRATSQ
ncbi:unnamed protein product [Ectocarpus sp. CCAP 1310/34]|nr:unnamed protein product [Ectocarpus sp. CCAP 1310/34]